MGSLITIRTFEFAAEAELAREYLDDQGIFAFLMDAKTLAMIWIWANAIGYIKLQVPSDRAAQALDLLREVRAAPMESEILPGEDAAAEDERDAAGSAGVLVRLHRLKRLIFLLYLTPLIAGAGAAIVAALAWLAQLIVGGEGLGRS